MTPNTMTPDIFNMTEDTRAQNSTSAASPIELYVVMGILSFLSVMGTAGNAMVLCVFSQKKDKLVSTLFIIVLAFVDFITCVLVMPYTLYMEYVNFEVEYDIMCKAYQFMITSNIPFSAMIMVAIAVDRYFCICHPFLHTLNIQRAKWMIAMLALMAVLMGLCVALMFGVYQIVQVPMVQVNSTHWMVEAPYNTTHVELSMYDSRQMKMAASSFYAESGYEPWTRQSEVDLSHHSSRPWLYGNTTANQSVIQFSGMCRNNEIIIGHTFFVQYQKFHNSIYLVCLIIVIVLYTLIYKSVLARRTRRQKQKSKSLPLIQLSNERTLETSTEETILTMDSEVNGQSKAQSDVKNGTTTKEKTAAVKARDKELREKEKQLRKSMKKDRHRLANLKTAAMLFVVTVVFIVTFCPACLMANLLIPYNMTVFYMYFANNVANPIIYSFMNKNFRDDMKKLFSRGR